MAYSKEQWERAKAYYEAGTLTQEEIAEKVGIDRSTIAKKAKSHNWEQGINADYVEAKVILAQKKSQLNSQTLQVLDDVADIAIAQKKLGNKFFKKIDELLDITEDTKEVRDLATAFNQVSAPFKDDRTQIAVQNNINDIKTITRRVID